VGSLFDKHMGHLGLRFDEFRLAFISKIVFIIVVVDVQKEYNYLYLVSKAAAKSRSV